MTTKNQQPETITLMRVDYDALVAQLSQIELLRKDNERLQEQLDLFKEQLILASKHRFGASSEKTDKANMEQLNLFNEAEVIADAEAEAASDSTEQDIGNESAETAVQAKSDRKPKTSVTKSMPPSIPVNTVVIPLSPEEQKCPNCGGDLEVIGTELAREEIVIIPASVEVRQYMTTTYACNNCEPIDSTEVDADDTEKFIIKSKAPVAVIKGGNASPEAVAYIAITKLLLGVPYYRQEQDFNRKGIQLSRQTMASWIITCSILWLEPIYRKLHEIMVTLGYLMADETTIQVLHEEGKTPQSKSYMWVYRTGGDAEMQIALYDYRTNRKSENPEDFLKGFKGYLSCDGYAGYNRLAADGDVILVGCWSHARRYWDQALDCLKPLERVGSTAAIGEKYCNKIFAIECEIADKSYEEKYELRQKLAVPVLKQFKSWLDSLNPAPKSQLGKAVTYCLNQWECLTGYLLDGRLECSNNRSERTVKPFVMTRKNFLFANTPGGADATAIFMSIIETAIENGLDPYKYLKYIFENAPTLSLKTNPNAVMSLLPNAPDVHAECAVPVAAEPHINSISQAE